MTTYDEAPPSAYALLWRSRDVLLESPAWIEYARQIYAIDPGGYPFLSYVGINFTKDRVKNYKFYFSFYRRLSAAEIDAVLPVPNRGKFDELYAEHWHPTEIYSQLHRGVTFAIKLEPDGKLTYYYHLRLRGLLFGPPQRLELADGDRDNYHGACEEFTGTKSSLKRYYYLSDRRTIADSLELAGMPEDRYGTVRMLEYIESDERDKLCWITGDRALIDALCRRRGQPRLYSGLVKICNDCGFDMYGPGSARDGGDHSIYFIETTGPVHPAGCLFDGVRTFARRHLKLDRFPDVP